MWNVGTFQWAPGAGTEMVPLEPVDYMQLHIAPGGTIIGRVVHTHEDGTVDVQLDWRLPEIRVDAANAAWRTVPFDEAFENLVDACREVDVTAEMTPDGEQIALTENLSGRVVVYDPDEWGEMWEFIMDYRAWFDGVE
jgi:hypothetical protein